METPIVRGHPRSSSFVRRILVSNDSGAARSAVQTADLIAACCAGELVIAHHATALPQRHTFHTPPVARQELTLTGDFVDAMIRASAHADLLVVGARGVTAADTRARGDTALRIAAQSASSVLFDRRDPDFHSDRFVLQRILVAVSDSESSKHALAIANEIAQHCGAELTVARVVPLATLTFSTAAGAHADDYTSTLVVSARSRVQATIDELEYRCPTYRVVVPVGDPADVIKALGSAFDLVILGSGRSSAKPVLDAGGVAARVAIDTACSVLIAR